MRVSSWSHKKLGKESEIPDRMDRKCALNVLITHLVAL